MAYLPRLRRVVVVLLALAAAAGYAGESPQAQPYEKISYPGFRDGRLISLLEAEKAMAYDLTEGAPRINLEKVVITLYDDSDESRAATPPDKPLPIKTVITSDRGFMTRRQPDPNAAPEDIANLEGDVQLRRFSLGETAPARGRPRRMPAGVETIIRCAHAQWTPTIRKLHGDGDVEFLQEDSRILGTGFMYLADDEVVEKGGGGSNIKDWGGVVFIEHNARMEIKREASDDTTVITCDDTASYKLREREVQFEKNVKVRSPGLAIDSDILKVFLRREDELPAADAADAGTKLPGQVKNIIATIIRRTGAVVITDGADTPQFTAKGGRADFDYDSNRITLVDSREGNYPEVEFIANPGAVGRDVSGRTHIRDDNLTFTFAQLDKVDEPAASSLRPPGASDSPQKSLTLETLAAFGGHGAVSLQSRESPDDPYVTTSVGYAGDLNYSRAEGRIRFREKVELTRERLSIWSEILDIRLASEGEAKDRLNRIIAENDVKISVRNEEGDAAAFWRAEAQRAEYDVYAAGDAEETELDTLRLYGPPQRTPPNPWIRDQRGNEIRAPEIHMQRQKTAIGQRDRHLMVARGGTSECKFLTEPDPDTGAPKIINIKCDEGMTYNERDGKAHFEGHVLVDSNSPRDSYVLTSDRLIINFIEIPDPQHQDRESVQVRRITADGSATLTQDHRLCEADKIIRDFPTLDEKEGEIYLQGLPARDGAAAVPARYIEREGAVTGAMFDAALIKSSADGSVIEANGPGSLSVPDDDVVGLRSDIKFDSYASYESFSAAKASRANFRKGVVLRQPSRRLTINSEELTATFLRDEEPPAPAAGADDDIDIQRIGRLRRAEFRNGVRVEVVSPKDGRQVAIGERGSIDLEPTGNIIQIASESQDRVRLQNDRGLTLLSPTVEMREGQGYIRADGPGELHIPADNSGDGLSKAPTAVIYGDRGSMVYNELALNLRVSDRVRILQPGLGNNWRSPSLDGNCDTLEITLFEPPESNMSGELALSKVQKMDAQGNVVVRVYADPPPENPNIDWLSRPGTTIFTKGDRGEFFVPESRVEISANPGRQPQLLLNVVDPPRAPHRQRMKADRFILNTNTMPRRWSFHGQQESTTIREGEPFEFSN